MLVKTITVQAQQMCLNAAMRVFNRIEPKFKTMEKTGIWGDITLEIRPYNQGYEIAVDIGSVDWAEARKRGCELMTTLRASVQPGSFFQDHLVSSTYDAEIEFQWFEAPEGYRFSTGRKPVDNLGEFDKACLAWEKECLRQVDRIYARNSAKK